MTDNTDHNTNNDGSSHLIYKEHRWSLPLYRLSVILKKMRWSLCFDAPVSRFVETPSQTVALVSSCDVIAKYVTESGNSCGSVLYT